MFRRKKAEVITGMDLAEVGADRTVIVPLRRATMIVYPAADGWRWRLVAPNGKLTADSGEAYIHRFDAKVAARRLADVAGSAKLDIRDRE